MLHQSWFSSDRGLITFYHKIQANNSVQGETMTVSYKSLMAAEYDLNYFHRALTAQYNMTCFTLQGSWQHDATPMMSWGTSTEHVTAECASLSLGTEDAKTSASYWLSFNKCASTFSGMWQWFTTYFMVRFPLQIAISINGIPHVLMNLHVCTNFYYIQLILI